MICPTCADAADNRLPVEAHCKSTDGENSSCDCQHRADRYRPEAITEFSPGLRIYSGPL